MQDYNKPKMFSVQQVLMDSQEVGLKEKPVYFQ